MHQRSSNSDVLVFVKRLRRYKNEHAWSGISKGGPFIFSTMSESKGCASKEHMSFDLVSSGLNVENIKYLSIKKKLDQSVDSRVKCRGLETHSPDGRRTLAASPTTLLAKLERVRESAVIESNIPLESSRDGVSIWLEHVVGSQNCELTLQMITSIEASMNGRARASTTKNECPGKRNAIWPTTLCEASVSITSTKMKQKTSQNSRN
jgi:hypothetical protein